jgi:ribosome recycling factor
MINVPEPRLITVQVYDGGAVDAVEKAIQAADLGLNPMRDGNLLRIAIPPLTEERRKDLVKKLNKLGEEEKVALRNHRRDANDAVKKQEKDKKITQDDSRKSQEEIQKVTDKFIAEIEQIMKQKEKEIMDV